MNTERYLFRTCIPNAHITKPLYPTCKVNGKSVYNEQIMSMPSVFTDIQTNTTEIIESSTTLKTGHYFFFIFNFENYYHFLYDTLPYLHFFHTVRKHHPHCKLLVPETYHKPLLFQKETFNLLGFSELDFEIVSPNTTYEFLHIPSSLTHGHFQEDPTAWASNAPPSPESFSIWKSLAQSSQPWAAPKKIYISRRSWIHGQTDNIGTNYTTRRKCLNEEALVKMLEVYGFEEVFCELLTMSQKIYMFQNATHIAGFIGGGMANLLFSPASVKVACLTTPDFLRINTRFRFSMDHTDIQYIDGTSLASFEGPYSLFTRVKLIKTEQIGEIMGWNSLKQVYEVHISETPVAGFSQNGPYHIEEYDVKELVPLDQGLNSPFQIDLTNLRQWCKEHAK